jgi:hypothetical protein
VCAEIIRTQEVQEHVDYNDIELLYSLLLWQNGSLPNRHKCMELSVILDFQLLRSKHNRNPK